MTGGLGTDRMRGVLLVLALAVALGGCRSRDERAGTAAVQAEAFLQQGNARAALAPALEATRLNDDVGRYWLLLARVQQANGMGAASFTAYQNVLESDPYNVEALGMLCLIAFNSGRVDELDRYSDRLLAINPGDRTATTFKAAVAVLREDTKTANKYLDGLLASDPNDLGALILKARLLAQKPETTAEAAALVERSIASGGDPLDRLRFLQDLYNRTDNRAGLRRVLQRIVAAEPGNVGSTILLGNMLFDEGDNDGGRTLMLGVMRRAGNSEEAANTILEMWRDHGPDAMPADTLPAASRDMSLRMKGTLARRAIDQRRPDVALAILAPALAGAAVTADNADTHAALAEALVAAGRAGEARRTLAAVLAVDPNQPIALALRARLATAAGKSAPAIADARAVLADDPLNASARLLLFDTLFAAGEEQLAVSALREGVRANPTNTRLAVRLATYLRGAGTVGQAQDVLANLTASAPMSLEAWRVLQAFCAGAGDRRCAVGAAGKLAQLRRAPPGQA